MNTESGTGERVFALPMLSTVRAFASEPAIKKTTVLQSIYCSSFPRLLCVMEQQKRKYALGGCEPEGEVMGVIFAD